MYFWKYLEGTHSGLVHILVSEVHSTWTTSSVYLKLADCSLYKTNNYVSENTYFNLCSVNLPFNFILISKYLFFSSDSFTIPDSLLPKDTWREIKWLLRIKIDFVRPTTIGCTKEGLKAKFVTEIKQTWIHRERNFIARSFCNIYLRGLKNDPLLRW